MSAPTFNRVDMLNCAAGHHDFSDDASECRVCGLSDLDASMPAPADPVRDAAPDMLAALRAIAGLESQTKADCIGLLKQARHIAKCTLAKAEGRSNG